MESFRVSDTMKVTFNENKKIDYIVLKLGNQTFSTKYADIKSGKIIGKMQVVETKGIGEQAQLWIKDKFSEGKDHAKLIQEVPFEINIYFNGGGK